MADTGLSLNRTDTMAEINQYIDDAGLDEDDDLDMITFIVAAQAMKPNANQEKLMEVFSEYDSQADDTPLANKMHKLLKQVKTSRGGELDDLVAEADEFVDSSDEEEDVDGGAGPVQMLDQSRSVQMEGEIYAMSAMARTEQKMEIAKEMLRQGISVPVVAGVTGLTEASLNMLINEDPDSPRQMQMMGQDEIAEVLRLCNGGPDMVASEAVLAHSLMKKMKNSLLAMTAYSKQALPEVGGEQQQSQQGEASPPTAPSKSIEPPGSTRLDPGTSVRFEFPEKAPEFYEVSFDRKPLGMSWNQTSDGKNLYVQDVMEGGLGLELGVQVGSVINSFNGMDVYNTSPQHIYTQFKSCSLPITIGFRRPVASDPNDPKVIMLKEVTGLETQTVIKLLHKFNGNVQAANEAFYVAKARTRQWIKKKQDSGAPQQQSQPMQQQKKRSWWKKWTKSVGN